MEHEPFEDILPPKKKSSLLGPAIYELSRRILFKGPAVSGVISIMKDGGSFHSCWPGWDGLGLDILQIKDQKTQITIPSVGLLKHVLFKQEGVS